MKRRLRGYRLLAGVALLGGVVVGVPAHSQPALPASPPMAELPVDRVRDAVEDVFERIWVPGSRLTDGPHVRAVFQPVVAAARQATVQVRSAGVRVAIGTVVGPNGWVLTKASRLSGPVTCRLADGRELDARLVGVDQQLDLAMLKMEAKRLPFFDLSDRAGETAADEDEEEASQEPMATIPYSANPQAGDWVATVGAGHNPVAVGVVSVAPRTIERRPGFLGITQDQQNKIPGVRIAQVMPKSAAKEAGLLEGDLIIEVEGQEIISMTDLKQAITAHNPGDRIEVTAQRGEERLIVAATLTGWAPHPQQERFFYQNNLGSDLSVRRGGFASALQHDTVLRPRDCGGPLVDLDGRIVGLNIARAGRTESYALPAELVRDELYDLMSGARAPHTPLGD